ncbi:TOPLESS-related 2 [Striga asiatica]|uniref:TOPLESS-related 2 n=1 Tax=Striga asiatica TaxID=4170 RepID=A0A5A7PC42_STRAF|nr:TOPLESS-related 2 [Striga asiatica]
MSSLSRELVFLILQFLDEEKFKEAVHKLEQESGFFFNMKYFEDQVQAGEWEEVERYLSGFTKLHFSSESFSLANHYGKHYRQNEQLSKYGDTKSACNIMLVELKKLLEANPLFRDKLSFPVFKGSRLRTLINQSLNWQHQLCKNPRPNPDIKTLFIDHSCASSNGARAPPPTNNPLEGPVPKPGVFSPLGIHGPFQPVVSPPPSAIAGWMSTANPSILHAPVAAPPLGLVQAPSSSAFLKHPRPPPGPPGMDYQTADSENLMKRLRPGQPDEVSFSSPTHPPNINSPDDLPKTVVRNLSQGSNVMSMEFHPQQQTVLLVCYTIFSVFGVLMDGRRRNRGPFWPHPVNSLPVNSLPWLGKLEFNSIKINLIYSLFMKAKLLYTILSLNACARRGNLFPVVIAANPSDTNQFALGMNDGGVHVIETSDGEAKWGGGVGGSTSQENGVLPSVPSSSALNAQPPSETPSR